MLKLRTLAAEDAEHFADWGMDDHFRSAAGWADREWDQHLRFHQDLIERNRQDPRRLAVTNDGELVGYVDFTPEPDGICELGIVIGPRQLWGEGYGRRALSAAVDYARHKYASSRVWARTHATNAAARHMLVAAGFIETGPCGTDEYRGESVTVVKYELPITDVLRVV